MFHVVLCDEDKRLGAQMEYFFQMNSTKIEFEIVPTGEALLARVKEGTTYDIYFIGNMLKKLNGVQIAKELRQVGVSSDIVFISGIDCYYYDAFEVEAFRFIKKPIDWIVFREIVQLLLERINHNNKYFYFRQDNIIHKIALEDILYFESARRIINVITNHGSYSFYDRLDFVEEQIQLKNNNFLRIHKSYLVNASHISQYEYSKLYLVNEQALPISENKRIEIRNTFYNYIDGFVCGITKKAMQRQS